MGLSPLVILLSVFLGVSAVVGASPWPRVASEQELEAEEHRLGAAGFEVMLARQKRLLRISEPIRLHGAPLCEGKLSPGHARAIMTLKDQADQIRLANDTVRRGATVRETERKARMISASQKKVQSGVQTPAELQVEDRLRRHLSTKVRLHHRHGKGKIEIYFHSLDELDAVLAKITN